MNLKKEFLRDILVKPFILSPSETFIAESLKYYLENSTTISGNIFEVNIEEEAKELLSLVNWNRIPEECNYIFKVDVNSTLLESPFFEKVKIEEYKETHPNVTRLYYC